jgi:hypothetical protein
LAKGEIMTFIISLALMILINSYLEDIFSFTLRKRMIESAHLIELAIEEQNLLLSTEDENI